MKTAEEFLKKWLGGNMNVSTLTPKAIAEFAKNYYSQFALTKEKIIKILRSHFGDMQIASMDKKGNYSHISEFEVTASELLALSPVEPGKEQPIITDEIKELSIESVCKKK
jgi:hypothetical protein